MNMLQESKYRGDRLGGDEEKRLDDDASDHVHNAPAAPQEIKE